MRHITDSIWLHQTSQSIRRPFQFNLSGLNGSLESITGPQECHYLTVTPLPASNLRPQNPYHWCRDHLNDSYCGKILRLPPCVKRSRMSGYYSPQCSQKVEKRAGKSRRMPFRRTLGFHYEWLRAAMGPGSQTILG